MTPAAISPPPTGQFVDLGSVVADWIEANLVHGDGDYYGQPFLLEPWQRFLLRRLYLVDAGTGLRVVRRALWVGPKGWGKSSLIGAVALAELAGPATLGPTGRPAPRLSPNIPIAAASYEQAGELYGAARAMASHDASGLAPFVEALEGQIRLKDRPGRLFRVAAEAGTRDGGRPTAFGADELHEWTGRKARVHLVLGNSLTKRREGLELNISTPDDAQPLSLLGRLVRYGERVAAGEVTDPSFLYVRYSASERWNLEKPRELRSAIRECMPASWVDVERIAARLEVDQIPEHEFRRYHLGQFVRPKGAWLPAGKWGEVEEPKRTLEPGTEIVLGFDGCFDDQTEVLTGRGWRYFKELGSEDLVATLARDGHVEWQRPSRHIRYHHRGSMLRFTGANIDLLVTPDHNMYLNGGLRRARDVVANWPQGRKSRPRFRAKKDALAQVGPRPSTIRVPAIPDPPRGRPIKHVGAVPAVPLLKLIGYYLAEGSVCRGSNYRGRQGTPRGRVVLSQKALRNDHVKADMAACVKAVGLAPQVMPDGVRIQSRELAEFLASECGDRSQSMRVPRWTLDLDASLLRYLFEAYMAGDGTTDKRWGGRSAVTTSSQLADDLQELALRLGGSASVSWRAEGWWHVRFGRRHEPWLHQIPQEEPYDGIVYDVTVPNHVLYVRRNGKPCWSGNSYNRDSTGLVACTLDGHLAVLDAWEREDSRSASWTVPRAEVDAAVDRAFKTYRVREMACDPHRWTQEIQDWMERYGEVVVEFPTSTPKRMAPACARFYGAVVSGGRISHDGDALLSRHLHNAVTKETRDGAYITKETRDSPRRIDLAVAAVMAYDRAMWHAGEHPAEAIALVIGG